MIVINRILADGFMMSLAFSAFVIGTLKWNYRIWIQDFPPDIRDLVPSKSKREKWLSGMLVIPFAAMLLAGLLVSLLLVEAHRGDELRFFHAWVHAYLVWEFVNLWDLVVLD